MSLRWIGSRLFLLALFAGGCTGPDPRGRWAGEDLAPQYTDGGARLGCVGLECRQVLDCAGGARSTLTGKVYDPSGKLPLYNATVYIPNAPLEPFPAGVSCERCGEPTSGSPLVTALSGPDGTFVLENVPSGDDVPLVIQVGRWRRQVVIPVIEACSTTRVADVNLTRLPRTQAEGDLPQMAIASGEADPFECLLKKLGIADTEFTSPTGGGRVHYYRENGIDTNPPAPPASTLWSNVSTLRNYDLVMLPCEGAENKKPLAATQNLIDYTSLGGRVFTTHFSYAWIKFAQSPFPGTGRWDDRTDPPDPFMASVDTTFPKGQAFSSWLQSVGASTALGQMPVHEPRHNVDAVTQVAQRWIFGNNANASDQQSVQHFTFNTPLDVPPAMQCGRVVFSDFHVSANAVDTLQSTFPQTCKDEPLSSQEKALAFMLFDLAACIQRDSDKPIP